MVDVEVVPVTDEVIFDVAAAAAARAAMPVMLPAWPATPAWDTVVLLMICPLDPTTLICCPAAKVGAGARTRTTFWLPGKVRMIVGVPAPVGVAAILMMVGV